MRTQIDAIQHKLLAMQDTAYRDFNAKLIPTVDPKLMIGIRTPLLRKFAKDLFKTEPKQSAAFMQTLPHRYFEENNLHAFLIENIKDFDTAITETERFLPFIDNWATCDTFAPPLFKKYPKEVYQKILLWIRSPALIPSGTPSISCCRIILMTGLNRKCSNSLPVSNQMSITSI